MRGVSAGFSLIVAIGFLCPEDPVTKEMKLLEGTWGLQCVESDGTRLTPEAFPVLEGDPTINKGTIRLKIAGVTQDYKLVIDPTKSPKHMDLVNKEGDSARALYGLVDDELKICITTNNSGDVRPVALSTANNQMIMTFKRKKN